MGALSTMNDYKEGRWLRGRILERLNHASRQFVPYLDSTKIGFLLNPFILSLSEQGDLLSQWRAYASGGKGVALGLESSRLHIPAFRVEKEQMPGQTVLANVIYNEEVQENVVSRIVHIIDCLVKELHGFEYEAHRHPFIPMAAYINMYLHYVEPLFKNPAFREEGEWRIVYFPQSHLSSFLEPTKTELSEKDEAAALRFRFREDDIVPHFLFPKESNIQEMISEIMLGPTCKMDQIFLTLFLNSCGVSSCSINRSKASLR